MNYKAQGPVEYLLILGSAILVVAVVISAVGGMTNTATVNTATDTNMTIKAFDGLTNLVNNPSGTSGGTVTPPVTPTVTLTSPANGFISTSSTVNFIFSFTGTDIDYCTFNISGTGYSQSQTINDPTTSPITVTQSGLPANTNLTWTVSCFDSSGASYSGGTLTLNYVPAPTVTLTSPVNGSTLTSSTSNFSFSFTGAGVTKCDLSISGAGYNPGLTTINSPTSPAVISKSGLPANVLLTWFVSCTNPSGTSNSTSRTVTYVPPNYALKFGTSNKAVIPFNYSPTTQLTVEFWFNLASNTPPSGKNMYALLGGGVNGSTDRYALFLYPSVSGGMLQLFETSNSINCYKMGMGVNFVTLNTWHHVAVVVTGGSTPMKLYYDGAEISSVGSICPTTNLPQVSDMIIGGSATSNFAWSSDFNGTIDEVRISKNAKYLANFTPSKTLTVDINTIAHWELNEGSGTIISDSASAYNSSANAFIGTPSPSWVIGVQ